MHISPQDFRDVQTLVRSLCGLVLSDDKTYLVRTRLESIVKARGFTTFSDYLGRLQQFNSIELRDELVEALTTGETSFSRDNHPFVELRRSILPDLAQTIRARRAAKSPIPRAKFWSAGCSTGQEPYSIAMAIHDFVDWNPQKDLSAHDFPILATDVSAKSLNAARAGLYDERDLQRGVTPEQRNRYFLKHGHQWKIRDDLRRSVVFRRLNFIEPRVNLGPFDVIFCRNVLIYFDEQTRQRLCDQFRDYLVDGGYLILGAAESLYGLKTGFQSQTIGQTIVYRKQA